VRLDCGPDHIAEITMVVDPACRRRGHGRQMFAAALGESRRRNLRCLIAVVDFGNDAALQFFAELGFEPDGPVGDRLRLSRVVHAGDHQPPLELDP
jgi:L-amino acid N-acyltransferase YncA